MAKVNHVYQGSRCNGTAKVECDGLPLAPGNDVMNHSPTGFEWGYGGSGPAQLALAILLNEYPKETALGWYQAFKWAVIAELGRDWTLTSEDIASVVVQL